MARYKLYDLNQTKMIPLSYADQVVEGSFEQALNQTGFFYGLVGRTNSPTIIWETRTMDELPDSPSRDDIPTVKWSLTSLRWYLFGVIFILSSIVTAVRTPGSIGLALGRVLLPVGIGLCIGHSHLVAKAAQSELPDCAAEKRW